MKKRLSLIFVLILCVSMITGTLPQSSFDAFAEEVKDGETAAGDQAQGETFATSEAYRCKDLVELFDGGKAELVLPAPGEATPGEAAQGETTPDETTPGAATPDKDEAAPDAKAPLVNISKNTNAKGMRITGTTGDISKAKIILKDSFDFDRAPVGRVSVGGLADRRMKVTVNVFLDEETEPFTTIPLGTQMGKSGWTKDSARSVDVLDKKLTGEHTVSLTIAFDGADADKKTELVLRSVEFAESSIPVMYFNIDESLGSIAMMNGDEEHDTECYGNVDITVPEGYTGEFSDKAIKSEKGLELEYIRGRGNSTWGEDKKPYKVKFDKKQNLFGMGKNKHWVLLANRFDNSLIRNRMTYWMTRELGKDNTVFAPECVPVEVVMNGDYYGNYLLTEQIRVGDTRVNIDDLEDDENLTATTEPAISGGYLLSKDYDEAAQSFTTIRGNEFYIESPEFTNGQTEEAIAAQQQYIKDFMQKTEEAIYGTDFKDPSGKSYSEYMDIPAALDFWWIQELSENGDAYGSGSTYLYKTRDKTDETGKVTEPGKLFWGPLWDFDYVAWGDLDYDVSPQETLNYTSDPWMKRLLSDPEFTARLKERWKAIDALLEEVTKKGGVLDRYADEVRISQQYDVGKYGYYGEDGGYYSYYGYYDRAATGGDPIDIEPAPGEGEPEASDEQPHTYDYEIEQLRSWIEKRRAWINADGNLDTMTPGQYTVTFKANGKVVETRKYYEEDYLGELPKAPARKGYIFLGWKDRSGDYFSPSDSVFGNMTLTADYVKGSKAKKPTDIFFGDHTVCQYHSVDDDEDFYEPDYTIVPRGARGTIKWSSSDTKVATVDSTGMVKLLSSGKTKITAKLPSGKKRSYTIWILGAYDDLNPVESMKFNKKTLTMKTGGYDQLKVITSPEPCEENDHTWVSSNSKIVSVDENGVLTAKAPGTSMILMFDNYTTKISLCKVTVKPTKKWLISKAKTSNTKVKAKKQKGGKVRLTWKKAKYLSGYCIYRSAKKNGSYKKVKTISKAKTVKWVDRSARSKNTWYKVRPFLKAGKKKYLGKWSAPAKAK